ncbi:SDR family oxidoreductase [Paraburkholderia caballeronis]|uniref:NAD(P)H dehydrogenase (Quinone) n=1 Tax=Paraburkholderia caballeronis TaxID=416943 RepID=A0A1H7JB52_9BURK|nr:SDR family oxidoreductase [Paraburkholderia caballeronis]PXW27495.1 NAD(P)H dehydrogenase (quinone) [Paraburkholderia caballeronis]PXX02969.1 NAD(P)H dehydrogenase (quinone) [Paraburkholderia caballeronis]RAK03694.1 NAD(P)H dehydrogenase (quinone) [Paraburkholderia caballeronis]SEC25341.1 NAD(P)H dehydrogenase (quinone) [Paraburkholderia caballeronis]SEK71828.1 NAD(P)H dehydrogenase (quinone) [Paraburkholderia caballeronis]
MTRILVTGATGGLGSQVVEFLLDRVPARDIVALARDPARLPSFAARGVEIRTGDYLDPASLERAFAGVDKLLLVSARAFTDAFTQHANVVEAAKRVGVRHLHYVSLQKAEGSTFEIPAVTQWERETEALLQTSGLDVTILRNTMYFDTLPFGKSVTEAGIRVPAGRGRGAFASRRDLAEGAAAALCGDGHEGKRYTLGGSEAVDMADIAAAMSEAGGQAIDYREVPVAEFIEARIEEGFPEPVAEFAAAWFQAIAAGEFSEVTGDLERLIGRPPQSARDFYRASHRA